MTGAPYVKRNPTERNAAVVTLAAQIATTGRIVLAGTVSADGSAIGAVRGYQALKAQISTIDGVAGTQGQVVTALALVEPD
ncbi:copper transporter [Micromonospora sp. WMMD1274]|uniref:copper transporter n=1 Tax=Micromonospora sp. WMMD1274 TaxID=3404116 RepID=UPI003B92330A